MSLLARDHTVVAPDLMGHGESAKPRGDYSLGAQASRIRDLVFGSKMEKIQSTISNNFLVVGPHYTAGLQTS